MRLMSSLLLIYLLLNKYSYAGDTRQIELTDGSLITGEIISLADDIYTIQSESLGILKINQSEVATIHLQAKPAKSSEAPAKEVTALPTEAMLQTLQKQMINDEEIMSMILALQDNPKLQEILANPDLIEATKMGDLSTLLSNPLFLELLADPQIKAIQQKITQ